MLTNLVYSAKKIIKNMRALLQLFDIKVLVYPERIEIKGTIPTQVLERITKEEPVTAPIISSSFDFFGFEAGRLASYLPHLPFAVDRLFA